jgi:molybdopterin synthase catalytic subunit
MKPWNPNIRVQAEPFDAAHESQLLTAARNDVGAVVTFTGLCRDEGGRLAALELEHYPGMAEAEIARIAGQAAERWPLMGLTAIHRTGKIAPGEPTPQGGVRGGGIPDGFLKDQGAVLEKGAPQGWRVRQLGRCPRRR